jgi:transposase
MEDRKASLQSKRGRQEVPGTLKERENELTARPLFDTTGRLEADVKGIEDKLRVLADGGRVVELLMTIPGCGEISAWTIRAYTDDIKRFSSPKKYTAYAGLVP